MSNASRCEASDKSFALETDRPREKAASAPLSPLEQSVTALPQVGARRAALLAKLGIEKLGDFLTFFPRDYEDRTSFTSIFSAVDGQKACIKAVVAGAPVTSRIREGLSITKLKVFDGSGAMSMTFFNNPYVKSRLITGQEYIFYGQIEARGGAKGMANPYFDTASGECALTGRIIPVYRLTKGVFPRIIIDGVRRALAAAEGLWEEILPEDVIRAHGLISQREAYEKIHFPGSVADIETARRRLVFEELFVFCLAGGSLKAKNLEKPGVALPADCLSELYPKLAFSPTCAQARAIEEIAADMASGRRMNRILQGDVGSGKTLVAIAAAFIAVKNGFQAVVMAPTELLASQHFESFEQIFRPMGCRCALLTSSLTSAQKREVKRAALAGEIDVLIGTHALIQQDVAFKNAALFVADEQHRFGVRQRAELLGKNPQAHLLVMSATPIPRTLSLIIYGDLDLSVLDELPPGRTPVQTFMDGEARRERIYRFLEKQVLEGGQAYIVCPTIEGESAAGGRAAAKSYVDTLQKKLPGLKIGLMHGRLRAAEKDAVMADFAARRIDVLVSTTVIEVGVNVPNASLMIVENADLFGLSQLHQLRGRVGRGARQSYCILMCADPGETARARLKALCDTNDGFAIAEQDLALRGPGNFFGNQQHGLPGFKIADLASDMSVLREALAASRALLKSPQGLNIYPALEGRVSEIIDSSSDAYN